VKIFKKKTDHFNYDTNRVCLSCSNDFAGRYCPQCGEKVIEEADRSFSFFLTGLLNAYTFIDGKFFKSLKTILLSPGQLSADISVGKRQPYMKPIAFFFVGNFIYFLFPIFDTFNTRLNVQINDTPHSEIAKELIISTHPDYETESFTTLYQNASTNWSKILLIVLVPLFFPFVALINFTKKKFLSDQLIYALELVSFIIFVPIILYSSLLYVIVKTAYFFGSNIYFLFNDDFLICVAAVLFGYYLIRSIRRFYEFPWWRTLLSAFLLLLSPIVVITVYRFILFYVTIMSI
jgi:hypothetical protein